MRKLQQIQGLEDRPFYHCSFGSFDTFEPFGSFTRTIRTIRTI